MKTKPAFRQAFPLASAIAALLASASLQAATLTWDNGASTGNWNTTDLNWTAATWNNATPDDATFGATGVGTVTLTEPITAGGITINSAGYTIDTSTFGLTLNTGITAAESAAINGAGGLALGAANAWSVAATKTLTVGSAISGAFGITKSDTGTLTLSGPNTYTGTTAVSAGVLSLGAANVIPDGTGKGNVSVAGTLDLNTFSETLNGLSGAGIVDTVAGGTPTLTVGGNDQTSSFTGVLKNTAGTLALTKIGTGSLTLAGTNTFSGQLTVESGTLSVATANNVSANGPLGNSALPVILGKTGGQTGTLSYTGATVTCTKPLTMASGGTGNISVTTSGTTLTLSGAIDGGGALSKSGSGTLTLTGATNSYSGGTVINAGTLSAATDAVLGSGGGITFEASATFTPGSVTYARSITLNNGAIASFNGGNPTFSGNVTGTGGVSNLNNFGNQVTFTGTGNTFEGQVRIGSGGTTSQAYRFVFSSLADSTTANGTIKFSASRVTHADGSVFQWNGSTNLVLNNRQIELASATGSPSNGHQIRNNGTGTVTINTNLIASGGSPQVLALRGTNTGNNNFAGVISNSTVVGSTPLAVAFTTTPTSTITLASVQGITVGATIGGTGIAAGTTITAINTSTREVTLSAPTNGTAGAVGQIMTVPGVINPTSVTKNTDAGTWTLSGNNTHSGGTTFSTGTLNINHAGALGTGTLTIGAGTFNNTSGAPIVNANNNAIAWNGDATFSGTNALDLGTGAVTMGGNRSITVGGTLTMGGVVSGAFAVTKGGGGTFVLSNTNSGYTGATNVNQGTLSITKIADYSANSSIGAPASGVLRLGSGTLSGALTYTGTGDSSNRTCQIGINNASTDTGGGTINNNGTGALTFTAATFNSANATATAARTLTLGGSYTGSSNTIQGVIQDNNTGGGGTLALAKSGAGTWTLAAANTYTGATSINGGTLVAAHVDALKMTSAVNISTASGPGILRLATDTPVTAFGVNSSSSNPGTIVSDRATSGAGITHALGNAFFGANTINITGGSNVASGTAGISLNTVTLSGGAAGTTVLNPTTATLTLASVTAFNGSPKTLELGGTNTGNAITGAVSDGTSIPVSLIKSNTSTWTLSGANTYTGTTSITGGTLALGANNVLPDTSAVSIGSATLDASANTLADTAGALTITGTAVINIGGAGSLAFAASDGATWTGTLNITGTLGANSIRFGTDATGLTTAQKNAISVNGSGAGTYTLDANGYLVAGGTSGYSSWQSANSTAGDLNADHDGDGVSNGVEYFLFGSADSSGFTTLPPVVNTGGVLSITWTKAATYSGVYTTDFVVETTDSLAAGSWTAAATSGTPATADTVYINGNNVTYTFPAGSKKFARLKVTGP